MYGAFRAALSTDSFKKKEKKNKIIIFPSIIIDHFNVNVGPINTIYLSYLYFLYFYHLYY